MLSFSFLASSCLRLVGSHPFLIFHSFDQLLDVPAHRVIFFSDLIYRHLFVVKLCGLNVCRRRFPASKKIICTFCVTGSRNVADVTYERQRRVIVGWNHGVSLRFISSLQLRKSMCKGCKIYVILALNKKGVAEGLEHILMVREFADIFSEKLPRMSPERELEFTIDLKPGTEPIARKPYRMSTLELQELRIQLKELLDLGMIRPSVSLWGAPFIFI
jgi:hypothetical protein